MTSPIAGDLAAQEQERKRKKRGAIIKFSLAGVALVGIGAAATSAAWTDDAWFTGTANSANTGTVIDLRGSLDENAEDVDWAEADTEGDGIEIPADTFQDLVAGDSVTVQLYVKNFGSRDLNVEVTPKTDVDTNADSFFAQDGVTVTLSQNTFSDLKAGKVGDAEVDVTIAIDEDASTDISNKTGALAIEFSGTPVLKS